MAVVVWFDITVTAWLVGVAHPPMVVKETVCTLTERLETIAPLFCHVPLSTCHCAPALTALGGLIETCKAVKYNGTAGQPPNGELQPLVPGK